VKKIKYFVQTTLFGGLLVITPLIVSLLFLRWGFNFLLDVIEPITMIIISTAKLNYLVSATISILIIFSLCFLIGLFVKTKLGIFSYQYFEDNLPGFMKHTVRQTIENVGIKKIAVYIQKKDFIKDLKNKEQQDFLNVRIFSTIDEAEDWLALDDN